MNILKQLLTLTMILVVAYATAIPGPAMVDGDSLVDRNAVGTSELQKRACNPNGCTCLPGTKRGQYCGSCTAVTNRGSGGSVDHVYECNPQGGCCDYGIRTSCVQRNRPCGPGQP